MYYFFSFIKSLFGFKRTNDESSDDQLNRPPSAKRLRLTMSSEDRRCSPSSSSSSSTSKLGYRDPEIWINAHILKQKYLENFYKFLERHEKGNENEELDFYKSLVNASHNPRNSSCIKKKTITPDGVIYIESDSDDDVVIISDDNSDSDSDVVEVPAISVEKSPQNRKDSFNADCLKDLRISNVISIESDSDEELTSSIKVLEPVQELKVKRAMFGCSPNETLITKFKLTITRETVQCLQPDHWLNDQIINFYFNLIMERSTIFNLPKVYAMNTFFFTKLSRAGHNGVKKWTKNVDIFSYDLIPVPYNQNNIHWCLYIINMNKNTIEFYDSLGSSDDGSGKELLVYLGHEFNAKKKKTLDINKWKIICVKGIPQQSNGSDCGVFTCTIAEHLCRNAKLSFSQKDMKYYRKKICLEVIQGSLLT